DKIAIKPKRVASSTSRQLKPSTPRKYSAPIDGIQGARSTNWNCGSCGLYQNHSGTDTRNPAKATRFAIHRIVFPCSFGTNSRTEAPTSGRKRTSASSGKCAEFVTSLPHEQINAQKRKHAKQHQQRVVLNQSGLHPPEDEARLLG